MPLFSTSESDFAVAPWYLRPTWWLVLVALSIPLLGILVPGLAPHGFLVRVDLMLLLALLGALAAQHQPLGGSGLGLGTLVLAPAIHLLGGAPAALVAAAVLILAATLRQVAIERLTPELSDERRFGRTLENATLVAVSCLLAAIAGLDRPLLAIWLYLLTYALLELLLARLRRSFGWHQMVATARPLTLDAIGWLIGLALASTAPSWGRTWLLLALFSLLAAEAARHALFRSAGDRRVSELRHIEGARARILGEEAGLGGIAQQVLVECRNILPVEWFELELLGETAAVVGEDPAAVRWSAGPEGALQTGPPAPPELPPSLPGIHRRLGWRVIKQRLEAEGRALAVVRLWCDPRCIEAGAEELLGSLVPQMASSLDRARLDREARFDVLTGVPVRRVLEARLQQIYRQICDRGRSMAVVMCDVDHFKRVNDTYGHAAGDAALRQVAEALSAGLEDGQLVCRYGGEEFTVLAENTEGVAALALADRLRAAVEGIELEWEGQRIEIRMSCGVAAFPELYARTAGELVLLADEALYRAKALGRNMVILNKGRGRFRDAWGREIQDDQATLAPVEPPRMFS